VQLVGDDVHVVREVQRLGGRLMYVPGAVVIHELPAARLRRPWLLRRAWWQGRSDWLLDAPILGERKYGGAAVAVDWYANQFRRRRAEGLRRSPVRFHALCDLARTGGALVGALRLARNSDHRAHHAGTVE
jgi:cellulose synthase/poly-beta-1,6-N-acetylglucosamine synthase-like glycosyltransferase